MLLTAFLLFLVVLVVLIVIIYFISDRVASIPIEGAHVVITGGSSGIGLSLAKQLARMGANITIIARDEKKLIEAHNIIKNSTKYDSQNITYFSVDVSNEQAVKVVINKAAQINKNKIDILVCCAGITNVERFMETSIKKISQLIEINYIGCVTCTRAVVPFMKQQKRGRIVYVASVLGLMGFPGYTFYSPTKFAVRGLAECLESELAPWNIHFSVSCPANVNTPMFEEEEKSKPTETKALENGKIPVSPDSVANGIINSFSSWRFLIASDLDSYLVSIVSSGFGPASFFEVVVQFLFAPVIRLVSMTELKKYRNTVKLQYQKEKLI